MQVLRPDGLIDADSIGYSSGLVEDGRVYLSGQVGWDEHFELAGDDITSQTKQAVENVQLLLGEADRSLDDVRKVTAYLVDAPEHVGAFLAVWKDVFEYEPYPCLTIIGVESLAQEAFLVELDFEVAERT